MSPKQRRISTLIESQLPGFITNEYEKFSKFVEKYYEHLESAGQPLDLLSNLDKYRNINSYEKNLLAQSAILNANILADSSTITLDDATSFPRQNGYVKIGEEILFYQSRTDTELREVSRGVSGNTTIGDLYHNSTFVTTAAAPHYQGDVVHNISNLFLYALVKEFEKTYLDSFPESYLKPTVDKRTLIKNISKFYRAKGTDRSIKFIFNSIVAKEPQDVPTTFNPKDLTLKSSVSDWVKDYSLKVKILSGDPTTMIGNVLSQETDDVDLALEFASAVVDSVIFLGNDGLEDIYQIILEPTTTNGEFKVAARTKTTTIASNTLDSGDRINVLSTVGFPQKGKILIGDEVIVYNDKTVNQFIIDKRLGPIRNHGDNKAVYSYASVTSGEVSLVPLGIMYNLLPEVAEPYSRADDIIEVTDPGFETLDPIIYDRQLARTRWFINQDPDVNNVLIKNVASDFAADIGAIFEDDQYYYVCSSGYPKGNLLLNTDYSESLSDQKHLKLIRKRPTTTTEVYTTPSRDVGIFLDGGLAVGYKSTDGIKKGPIVSSKVENRGVSYDAVPFVLVNEQMNKARATLAGTVVDSIEILTEEEFTEEPTIRITSGEGAILSPVITNGAITSMDIINPGKYYSSPPIIRIADGLGKGNFAEFEAVLNADGSIEEVNKINGGRFYTRGFTTVVVEAIGKNASASVEIRKWVYNRYEVNKDNLDDSNGTILANYNPTRDYGYAYIANPIEVRKRAYNTPTEYTQNVQNQTTHSPILGYAYDGNPIYGPYGYTDPVDPASGITRLLSGYVLAGSRPDGPDTGLYPLGTFIDDFTWTPSIRSGKTELDANNGRFCVTPDYPDGTYAYFITVDANEAPVFPYILGVNYYSLPVDSNYNSNISQDDIPTNLKALRTGNTEKNGTGFSGLVRDINVGNVDTVTVEDSTHNFSPGNTVHVNNANTSGEGSVLEVKTVTGKTVSTLESNDTKAQRVHITQSAYLFAGDTISQSDDNGGITGQGILIGDVFNGSDLVLRNVLGDFNTDFSVNAQTLVLRLVLDNDSSFTIGSTLSLTDDDKEVIATGEILETTTRQNSVKVKVLTGAFVIDDDKYLRSSNLSDTNRSRIIQIQSLSTGLTAFEIDKNIAIIETDENHNVGVGDEITVTVTPDDSVSTTTNYVRKRLYQDAVVFAPTHSSTVVDKGIGSSDVLNSGRGYTTGTYVNVELIFQDVTKARDGIGKPGDPGNARCTITVSSGAALDTGTVTNVIINEKGTGYRKGDILTVTDASLSRVVSEESSQRLTIEVDHVGFAASNTKLDVSNVSNLSQEDFIQIGNEILEIEAVDSIRKTLTVKRGQHNTIPLNHYNNATVTLVDGKYRFDSNFRPFGVDATKPYLIEYDESAQTIAIAYEYSIQNPQVISTSSSFFDSSVPSKLVSVRSAQEVANRLEFSTDNVNFSINPVIPIQKYYKYIFDVSHSSMVDTFLDFSSSANYNIFTEEKETSGIAPGNTGSFVSIKLGFGPAIAGNSYTNRQPINFQNYFYFIKVSPDVNTGGSYLRIIDDPLTGPRRAIYTTDTRIVYALDNVPAYDGTGTISYTTSGRNAVGNIDHVRIVNTGDSYLDVPIVDGVSPTSDSEALVDPVWDSEKQTVVGFIINEKGSGYSKPVVVITDGDGIKYQYECDVLNGSLSQVRIIKEGGGFTYKPTAKIAEGDVKIYLESSTIGTPKNVRILDPGRSFNGDKSTLPEFKSVTTLVLSNISADFKSGELITQPATGATAIVLDGGFRKGGNLLRVRATTGTFGTQEIQSVDGLRTATIKDVKVTKFTADIKSYVDNFGSFRGDRGKLSAASQRLQDSFYYQDYSYVVRSKTSIDVWRNLLLETTHPAGFKMFGEMVIDSKADIPMPVEQPAISHFSVIELPTLEVTSLSNKIEIVNSWAKFEDLKIETGVGSVSVDTFDTSETNVYELALSQPFDGDFDPNTGQLSGTKTFTLIDKKTGSALSLAKAEQLQITLDGVWQEPGVAFTLSGTEITFAVPPFGNRIVEGQATEAVKFYGRGYKFKNSGLNDRYFRTIKDISDQFDGVKFVFDLYWEDDGSAVRSDPNENFIVTLNGVVQKARTKPGEPFGNSYDIDRSGDTDKIIFSKPPIDNEDLYGPAEELPEELKVYEKCFIYSVGSYERLTIQSELIEYRFGGPYLIIDEVTNEIRKIDNSSYALVFIDGVLQRETDSYRIVGPNITFTDDLIAYEIDSGDRITQDINIILLYGRDVPRSLTFYDYELNTFNNTLIVTLEGTGISEEFNNVYAFNSLNKNFFKQGDKVVGRVFNVNYVNADKVVVTFQNPINITLTQDPLVLVNLEDLDTSTVEIPGTPDNQSYDWDQEINGDGDLVLDSNDGAVFVNGTINDLQVNLVPINAHAGNQWKIDIATLGNRFVLLDSLDYVDRNTPTYAVTNNGSTGFYFDGNTVNNPTLTATYGDVITFVLNLGGAHQWYLTSSQPQADYQPGDDDVPLELAPGATRQSGQVILDTVAAGATPATYWYVCPNHPVSMQGEIEISDYVGEYYNVSQGAGNELNLAITDGSIVGNNNDNGTLTWDLDETHVGVYFYTITGLQKFGFFTVLEELQGTQFVEQTSPKEFPVGGTYDISFEYKLDDDGDRVLERNVPVWLYGTKKANEAWNNKNSMTGNLLPGDLILIDGESEYREVLATGDTAKTKTYRPGDYVHSGYFGSATVTDYTGDTEGVGLSVTANVNEFGNVTTLNVSDVEWNQRDFQLWLETGILLQPTAYEYYTTPVLHFIPVDGNGGGAKAEVIAYGGQILDVVVTDGGSGYTQPPKVVVARRYKRIKENARKIDTLTQLTIGTKVSLFTEVTFSAQVTLFGDAASSGVFSIASLGGFVAGINSKQQITSMVQPEENIVRMNEVTVLQVAAKSDVVSQVSFQALETRRVITAVIGGIVDTVAINTISSTSVSIDLLLEVEAAKAYRKQERTESINGVGTFLDAPMGLADTIAYVPTTERFPDTPSRLRIGREVIYYTGKKSDRFTGLTRGYQFSINETHSPGDIVLHYPETVTLVSGGVNVIHSIGSVSMATTAERKSSVQFQIISEVQSITDVDINLVAQAQVEAPKTFQPEIIEQITIIPPTSVNIVTTVHSTKSLVRPINAPSSQVAGSVTSQVVTLTQRDIQLTAEKQIELESHSLIVTENIGAIAATSSATSKVVTSAYNKTDEITTVQKVTQPGVVASSIVHTTEVASLDASIQSTSSSVVTSSIAATLIQVQSASVSLAEPFTMFVNREVTSSVQDINTTSTRFSMILGGGFGIDRASTSEIDYRSAVVDYIIEDVVLETFIKKRDTTIVTLADPYNEVIYRDGSSIQVINRNQFVPPGFERYSLGNAGHNLNTFENTVNVDQGINVAMTIETMDQMYPDLTLRDFELRNQSALLANGDRFNVAMPTYQQPATTSTMSGTLNNGVTITVGKTTSFDDEGFIFTESGNVVEYTSKTETSFVGCTVIRGGVTISNGDLIVPFQLV